MLTVLYNRQEIVDSVTNLLLYQSRILYDPKLSDCMVKSLGQKSKEEEKKHNEQDDKRESKNLSVASTAFGRRGDIDNRGYVLPVAQIVEHVFQTLVTLIGITADRSHHDGCKLW